MLLENDSFADYFYAFEIKKEMWGRLHKVGRKKIRDWTTEWLRLFMRLVKLISSINLDVHKSNEKGSLKAKMNFY